MTESYRTESAMNEPGYLLGFASIGLLVLLLVAAFQAGIEAGPIRPGAGSVLLGLYVMAWGFMFLASYFYSHKSFFFRALIWVCERLSFPASRAMALFYFVLALVVGGATILAGFGLL